VFGELESAVRDFHAALDAALKQASAAWADRER
jgi:hypothetical protein